MQCPGHSRFSGWDTEGAPGLTASPVGQPAGPAVNQEPSCCRTAPASHFGPRGQRTQESEARTPVGSTCSHSPRASGLTRQLAVPPNPGRVTGSAGFWQGHGGTCQCPGTALALLRGKAGERRDARRLRACRRPPGSSHHWAAHVWSGRPWAGQLDGRGTQAMGQEGSEAALSPQGSGQQGETEGPAQERAGTPSLRPAPAPPAGPSLHRERLRTRDGTPHPGMLLRAATAVGGWGAGPPRVRDVGDPL